MSTFYGQPKLEDVVSDLQDPYLLGDEWDMVAANLNTATDMYINQDSGRVRVKWLRNTGSPALAAGEIVMLDVSEGNSYDVEQGTAGSVGYAIVSPFITVTVPTGSKFCGIIKGETDVLCGGAITVGASVGITTAGRGLTNDLSSAALQKTAFGRCIETGASGVLSKVIVDFVVR